MSREAHAATIADLHRRLSEAEQTILAFTRGEIDAVVDSAEATPILLRHAQDELLRREQLLRAIFDGVGDGILLVAPDGVCRDANPAACGLFGVPKSELVGRRIEDFTAPGFDVVAEGAKLRGVGRGHGTLRISRPDGAARVLEYSLVEDILPELHLAVLRDITDRSLAERALVTSEKKYRQIVDTAREGIWLVDAEARTTFVNRALEEMLGCMPGEILGRSAHDFMDAEGLLLAAQGEELRRQGVAESREQKYLRKDGRELWVHMEAGPLSDESGKPTGTLAMVTDVTDRRRAEEATRASEERYRLLFENSPLAIWLVDIDSLKLLTVNQAGIEIFGYTRAEFLALTAADLLAPEERPRVRESFSTLTDEGARHANWHSKKKDGSTLEIALTAQNFLLDGRSVRLCIGQDLSERNRLEAQLAQSRKMEAIGILAGGVAHDFNNLLSIMVTYTAFTLEALPPGDPLRSDIEQVAQAGERATALTHQLLAFSRRQILEPKILNLNATLAGLEPMLRRLLAETIEIVLVTEPSLGSVSADPGQVEQVIMNLVVNARDAMPDGGELTIETANVSLEERHSSFTPGQYVRLSVSDTGLGMDAATRAHIFEPFFTTKELGKGTGLGLSTVLGIIQQSEGHLEVRSVLGKGTTFDAFLPRVDRTPSVPVGPPGAPVAMGGSETVLLVEDDEQVRTLSRSILRRNGYEVLAAANAGEAFLISEQHLGRIHLLLTDVMMPRMNGRQLAERLALTRPDMKVLFMTGYTDDSEVRQAALQADVALLHKPITPLGLARSVRALLDAAPAAFARGAP